MVSDGLVVFIAIAGLFLIARNVRPARNQSGGAISAEKSTTAEPVRLCVASFNIQTGKSLEGKRGISRSAAVLAQATLAGVQEVYAATWLNRLGVGHSQSQALSAGSGARVLFCATRRRWFREHRGNALLSKLAVQSWRTEMLPDQSDKSYRNMTIAEVSWQDQSFHFINTHLHTRGGRERQLQTVLEEFAEHPRAILVGDFNTTSNDPILAATLGQADVCDAIAELGLDANEPRRIDWILTKGFKAVSGQMLEKASPTTPIIR